MGLEKSFDEKIDVIDLIINVLKYHETNLDELVSGLESVPTTKKENDSEFSIQKYTLRTNVGFRHIGHAVTAILQQWSDFRKKGTNSEMVTFDSKDDIFKVSAQKEGIIYVYQEDIPHMGITYRTDKDGAQVEGIDINKLGLMPIALKEKLDCGLLAQW